MTAISTDNILCVCLFDWNRVGVVRDRIQGIPSPVVIPAKQIQTVSDMKSEPQTPRAPRASVDGVGRRASVESSDDHDSVLDFTVDDPDIDKIGLLTAIEEDDIIEEPVRTTTIAAHLSPFNTRQHLRSYM